MNIQQIDREIKLLENGVLTSENARDLASLYIIQSNIQNTRFGTKNNVYTNETQKELNDIYPSYHKYINARVQHSQGILNEDVMLKQFQMLCTEIYEFIRALYTGTSTFKERKTLENTIDLLKKKIF